MGIFGRRRAAVAPHPTSGAGDNGAHSRHYDGGSALAGRVPSHEPIDAAYLRSFGVGSVNPAELRPVVRVPARPARYIAQGAAHHVPDNYRGVFTGGHTQVRRAAHGNSPASAVSGVEVTDTRSRFFRTRPRPVPVSTEVGKAAPLGSVGQRIAPAGGPQMHRPPTWRPEVVRVPRQTWNGGAR